MLIIAVGAVGAGPARPADRAPAGGRRGAQAKFADEKSEFLSYPQDLDVVRGRASTHKKTEPPAAGTTCRANFLSQVRLREWRDVHSQLLHASSREQGWRLNDDAGDLRAAAPGAADGPARQRRLQERRRTSRLPRRARHQVPSLAGLVAARRSRAAGSWRPNWSRPRGCTRAASRRSSRSGWSRSAAHLLKKSLGRAALGEAGGAGRRRSSARRCTAWSSTPAARQLRQRRPGDGARDLHPRGAGGRRLRDARAVLRAQPASWSREIENLEHKSRRLDVLVDDELIFAFYDAADPAGRRHTAPASRSGTATRRASKPKLLFLNREDLMRHEAAGITTDLFPKTMTVGRHRDAR